MECASDPSYVPDATDCDDADPSRHPGAADPCNDIDEDCDGADFCSLEGTLDIRLADAVIYTSDIGHAGGTFVARRGGDINGDGFEDAVVGLRGGRGGVWVLNGTLAGYEDITAADALLSGENDADNSGIVAPVGDLNGDGYDDLVVGGPNYPSHDPSWLYYDGVAYVVYGPVSGEISLADADGIIYGESWSMFGHAISGAGDLDGDGYDDFLVGAPLQGSDDEGAAFVFHGPLDGIRHAADADAVLQGDTIYIQGGYSISAGHDVNADGVPDILVGTYQSGAYLFTAVPAGITPFSAATARFECEAPCGSNSYGPRLALPGDMDGDGGPELMVGDPFSIYGSGGAAFLFHGFASGTLPRGSATTRLIQEVDHDWAGISVAALGDVDGDGSDDVMIGAAGSDVGGPDSGAAYLFYGPLPSGEMPVSSAGAQFVGISPVRAAGHSVASAGDVNADGLMDLFIMATAEVEGIEQTPNYLFYGRPR